MKRTTNALSAHRWCCLFNTNPS